MHYVCELLMLCTKSFVLFFSFICVYTSILWLGKKWLYQNNNHQLTTSEFTASLSLKAYTLTLKSDCFWRKWIKFYLRKPNCCTLLHDMTVWWQHDGIHKGDPLHVKQNLFIFIFFKYGLSCHLMLLYISFITFLKCTAYLFICKTFLLPNNDWVHF